MSIKRNPDESFEDFKERRITDNINSKNSLKPKLFHDSYHLGTYTNTEKNEYKTLKKFLGSKRQLKKFNRANNILGNN